MSEAPKTDPHIRLIHLREDLLQIADLIELCFSKSIDAEGIEYIKHIRQTARNFGGFILENTTPENSTLPFNGYVWVENHKIIGNLTLIPLRNREKGSYFVANVAVHPDFQGRGIGRQLTQRAIRHVREHQGRQIFLQVRDDNPSAIHLYQDLGFDEISRRTMWVKNQKEPAVIAASSETRVTPRTKDDWSQQKLWLETIYPKEIRWNIPFRIERMEPTFSNWLTRFLSGESQQTWAARNNGKLIGTVTFDRTGDPHDYLWLASSLLWEDELIRTVIPIVQRRALFPQRLAVNFPAGRARSSFEAVNMRELNTLLWMKYRLFPQNDSQSIVV